MHTADFEKYRALAERYCNRGVDDCRWYHGNWHLLKSLGIVSTSSVHEDVLGTLLRRALGDRAKARILISGSTDETLLRIVHATCLEMQIDFAVTAADICATPLQFMAEYAHPRGIELRTVQSNLLNLEVPHHFDVIITHAFMGYFDDEQRPGLVGRWRALLNPGGRVVTIQRVRPETAPCLVRFSAQQTNDFISAAQSAAMAADMVTPAELARVRQAAQQFAGSFKTWAIRSQEAFEGLFSQAGLKFEHLEYQQLHERGNLSGPSVPSAGRYAQLIATSDGDDT